MLTTGKHVERRFLNAALERAVARSAKAFSTRTAPYYPFTRWRKAGAWDRIMDAIAAARDGDVEMFDSTSGPARQHAATAKRGPDYCLGRSRGRRTTKPRVVVDAQRLAIQLGPDDQPGS